MYIMLIYKQIINYLKKIFDFSQKKKAQRLIK